MRIASLLAGAVLLVATPAFAQTDTAGLEQALSTCLVQKSTGADRQALVRWILGGLASSSLANGLVKVDSAAKEDVDRGIAGVYNRLLTVDCATEIKAMSNAGDSSGIEKGFSVLGRIAMRDAMADPSVNAAMTAFVRFMPHDAAKKP